MSEHMMPIPSRVYNAAVGGHVCGAVDIIDDALGLEQSSINEDVAPMPYNDGNPNGMGRIILKKTDNFKNVVEAQSGNTIFIIKYDYTLTGDVIVPANCILEFDGGSISNGTIKGTFRMNDPKYKVFNNVTFLFEESFLIADYVRPEWFGAKGDYDWNTKTGTDDSQAFTNAFRAAEVLSIGKVKIMSSNYYISTGIHVTSGNVWLEGVRALLRDDQAYSYPNSLPNRGSMLICPDGVDIITLDFGIAEPFRCTNVQFKCKDASNTSVGIKCNGGGIWGFYIEYCHFESLHRAIILQNSQDTGDSFANYCIYNVYINNNTFATNGYCVYFPTSDYQTDTSLMDNFYTWQFEFKNNKAHHNARILRVGCQFGVCNISDNNLEGNYSDGDEPQSTILTAQGCNLIFENNYFEANTIPLLKIICYPNNTILSAKGNNVQNVSSSAARRIIVSSNENIQALLKIEDSDIPLDFNNANNIVIQSEYPINNNIIRIINSNNIIFQTKYPIESTDVFNSTGWDQRSFQCPSSFNNGSFKGDKLFTKMVGDRLSWGHTFVNAENLKTIIFFYMHIAERDNNGECLFANNGANSSYIFNIDGRINKDFPYLYGFSYTYASGSDWGIFTRNNTGVFVREFGWALKDVDPSSEIPINIMSNLMRNINMADSISSITTLNNKKISHRIYQKSNNKEYCYNGSDWVDSTGTPV